MRKWNKLPIEMQKEAIMPYYKILKKRKISRFLKRCFDIVMSFFPLIILFPFFLIIAFFIKITSKGPVFYRQVRVTRYNKDFRIFKFRTMVVNADQKGSLVTTKNDSRITKIGKFLRKTKLDELPQLINVLFGQMTFVGTRPEVRKYVDAYSDEMLATLLMPAGITSSASVKYKDEASLIENAENVDDVYINVILNDKMKYNLEDIKKFNFFREIGCIIKTVL
ncbi:MAG: sugar transferase [Anaeroplasmataceae bacterium]|nr:sugar transferase [Anaeroplasmataceae bacterium]